MACDTKFYEAVFGWKFILEESLLIEYYRIETTGIHGGLLKRPVNIPNAGGGTNAYTCSMQVESFDATAEIVMQNGGRVAIPKFVIPGRCWQGYFLDANNNVFGIFEANEKAA